EGKRSTSDNTLIRHLSDALRFYFEFHRHYGQGYLAHVHDFFAAGVAAGTLEYDVRPATVDVETDSPLLLGTTVADFRGLWAAPPNAMVVTGNNPGQAFDELVSAVGGLARRVG
ncbi:MAG: nucleoside hydrolase, partial [Actinomycetes bacterium]